MGRPETQFLKDNVSLERLKNVQRVELELLEVLRNLCEKHQLKYYMMYGTLLGAVRHKGCIPWDDDIDIALPREDYNKLLKLVPKELKFPFFLQTPESDEGCFYGGYAKLRNSNTTAIEISNWGQKCNQGIWIDIFPLDYCYVDKRKNKRLLRKIRYYQRMLFAKTYANKRPCCDLNWLTWNIYCFKAQKIERQELCISLNEALCECKEGSAAYLASLGQYRGKSHSKLLPLEWFEDTVWLEYENLILPAPGKYQDFLKVTEGVDFMDYPPVEERKPHHAAFFAPNVPYEEYVKRFMDTFKDADNKTIILFGAGLMSRDYLIKFGKRYPPSFVVDNDSKKWGKDFDGVPIKSPQAILEVSDLHLIICNSYFREVEKQVRKMGVFNYYIYVQKKEWLAW